MNCANHADAPVAAYCRTCGKPLCTQCTRDVRGVIFCEHCLAERLEGTVPPGVPPVAGGLITPVSSGPNPALAGMLGAIPFGVGAVYNGQYAKGLAHLIIFCLLVFGANTAHDPLDGLFGVAIAFFVLYQIFDAVRTAKALQMGQPAPDPLGLGQTFGAGEKFDTSTVPTAAIVLIVLGVLFLLQTSGILDFSLSQFWPLLLIALGGWLIARRVGMVGTPPAAPASMVGPAVLITIGSLSLLENLHGPGWGRTWPVLFLAIGLAKLVDHRTSSQLPPAQSGSGPMSNSPAGMQPPASPDDEVKHG